MGRVRLGDSILLKFKSHLLEIGVFKHNLECCIHLTFEVRHVVGLSYHIQQRGFLRLYNFKDLLSKFSLIFGVVIVSVQIL